jgi:DNA end-binding protein Ku
MRYAEELRKPQEYFSDIKVVAVDEDQLGLAKELIKRKSSKFAPEKFTDDYEAALRAMVEAKVSNAPIPREEPAAQSSKVVNLMDALRKSVQRDEEAAPKKAPARATAAKTATAASKGAATAAKKGIALVGNGKAGKSRKSA